MTILDHFKEAQAVLTTFLANPENIENVNKAGQLLAAQIKAGRKVIACGNGGSMCDAMHFAEELSGRYKENRKALAALSISDPSHISCVGNDYGYAYIFSRYIEAIGQEGDVLLAISTSGNSENILRAIDAAHQKGMQVIGLTGKNGGKMANLVDLEIRAPYSEYADRAQEIHIKVIHSLIDYIEQNS